MSSALGLRLQRFCNELLSFYTIFLGMSSYRYHYATRTYGRTRLTRHVALVSNILTLFLLPPTIWYTWLRIRSKHENYYRHPVLLYCNISFVVSRNIGILYTVLSRYSRDEASSYIIAELQRLYENYLEHLPLSAARETLFKRLFFLKYTCFLLVCFFEYFSQCNMKGTHNDKWYEYVHIVVAGNLTCILFVATFGNFRNLLYVCRGLCQINERLRELIEELRSNSLSHSRRALESDLLAQQLRQLMDAHWSLAKMIQGLNDVNRYQSLILRFICFVENVIIGFWMCTYGYYKLTTRITAMASLFSYVVKSIDLYLIDLISDQTLESYNATIRILQSCNEFQQRCKKMESRCEQFSLRLNAFQPRLSQCGLFNVDKRLWFRMFSSVVSYTILVVQFYLIIGMETVPYI